MSSREKTIPMRMSESTVKVVNMIAAAMQLESGMNVSADAALFKFLADHKRDLPDEARAIIEERQKAERKG